MTPPLPIDLALRFATILVVASLAAVGLVLPSSLVIGGGAWLAFLLFAMSGWGFICVRAGRLVDPDFGLRAAWGAGFYLAAIGLAVAVGAATRGFVLGSLGVGFALFAWREMVTPEPLWNLVGRGLTGITKKPAVGFVVAILVGAIAIRVIGALAAIDRNPWDDDVAYTPLVKRMLDAGNLIEPFSFRRLSAYGGQTALQALFGARGTLGNVHAADKGLFFSLVMLLVLGEARSLGRVPAVWLALVVAMLTSLPDIAINSASEWTGVAMIFAMYRTVVRAGRSDDPHRRFGMAALVGAGTCALRQSYIPVVVLFLGLALATRLYNASRDQFFRAAWEQEKRSWRNGVAIALVALVPWWVAAWESNHTFLFPLLDGTWNHGLSLRQTAYGWLEEVAFVLGVCLETAPLFVLQPLALLIVFTEDDRPARSLKSLFVACVISFLYLAHSFTTADWMSIWRYTFGYGIALTAVFALEVANESEMSLVRLPPIGRWAVLACVLLQIVVGRTKLPKQFAGYLADISDARHGDPSAKVERKRYAAMQAAIPAGARVAVMLDDAAYLDWSRNAIANLDTPGWASPGTQMPCFMGPEALRQYFVAEGYRYFAFVRTERSRYFYRREFWVQRIFIDSEVFQTMSAYVIDAIDNATALATTIKPIYDTDGLVVLDLGTSLPAPPVPDPATERERRSAWFERLADGLQLHDAWTLAPRADLTFEDGLSGITFADGSAPKWFEIVKPAAAVTMRGTPVRWMHRRAHLRVAGERAMHLTLKGRVDINAVFARPHIDASIDGNLISSTVADDRGAFTIDTVVPANRLGGWHDLYVVFATVSEPEKDIKDLRTAWLESVEWVPDGR